MDKRVTVLLPNGRRQNVPITSNTTLLQILEAACERHKLESSTHCLKFHNKYVDLNQMFRFSGLPNNCVLEMEPTERKRETESKVVVCMQNADNVRRQGEFTSSSDLWTIAQELHASELERYDSPVIVCMRAELVGKEQIKCTTLKSLGINNGGVIMHLLNKTAEELKLQANVYKQPVVKELTDAEREERAKKPKTAVKDAKGGTGGFALSSDMIKSLKKSANEPSTSKEDLKELPTENGSTVVATTTPKYDWGDSVGYSMKGNVVKTSNESLDYADDQTPPEVHVIGPREAVLISLDQCRKRDTDLSDDFFDLTASDLRIILRDLRSISKGTEEQPLLTRRLRDLEHEKSLLRTFQLHKECIIRVRFPDRHVLQGVFKPHENLRAVEEFVRTFIVRDEEQFQLFTTPPKKVLAVDESLLELNLVPKAILHFAYENEEYNGEEEQFLKPEYLKSLTSEEGASYVVKRHCIQTLQS